MAIEVKSIQCREGDFMPKLFCFLLVLFEERNQTAGEPSDLPAFLGRQARSKRSILKR